MSLAEIRERHAHAEAPSSALDGLKNINLVYSGLGRQAHEDRAALLAMVDDMQKRLDRWEPKMTVSCALSATAQNKL